MSSLLLHYKCFWICWLLYALQCLSEQEVLLFSDPMGASTASEWTYNGNVVVPSTANQCSPQNSCFELNNGGWVEKNFSTQGYHNINFKFVADSLCCDGRIIIKVYDADAATLLTNTTKNVDNLESTKTIMPSPIGLWDDISKFKIRFEQQSNTIWIDSLRINGVPITPSPIADTTTVTATTHSTTTYSSDPTMSYMSPSVMPTVGPIQITNKDDGVAQEGGQSTTAVSEKENDDSKQANSVFSDDYLLTHWYYLVIVFICCLCMIMLCWWIKTKNSTKKIEDGKILSNSCKRDREVMEMQCTDKNEETEMEQISFPSIPIAQSVSPTETPLKLMQLMNMACEKEVIKRNKDEDGDDYDEMYVTMEQQTTGGSDVIEMTPQLNEINYNDNNEQHNLGSTIVYV